MPSKYPRIGVVCDPELDVAMRSARDRLGPRLSSAALLRGLALRGADALRREAIPDHHVQRLVDEHRAQPARAPLVTLLSELEPVDPNDRTPGSDALEKEREERLP